MRSPVFSRDPAPLRPTVGSRVITTVIAFVGCLVIPAAVSLVLGMSRLTLTKQNQQVTAHVERLLFFAIPWKTQQLSGITAAKHEVIAGSLIRQKTGDTRPRRRAMDNAVLHLTAQNQTLDVALDPATAPQIQADVTHFIHDPDETHYHQFLMENRLYGWLFGVPVTLLAGFYTICVILACGKFLLQLTGLLSPRHAKSPGNPPALQAL
jgi:hypothetical protein